MEEFDLDILTSSGFSDVLFGLKSYNPEVYKYSTDRSPQQIKRDVLDSPRVQHIIMETANERSEEVAKVKQEAEGILDEMAHNFSLNTIRFMAFTLKKILTTLYRKVLVNKVGLDRLKAASQHNPVVLVPCHRSYMDFLLVSFVCFAANLPLPFVAAGQDFNNMRVVRRLFRKSGAFFMRRSFMSDKLYWVIFTEYVQNQLQKGQHSLEFFLEGTRSRTGKFLHPRLGLLSMVVDLYANAGVPNILLCPISITYDRVLEESLFAYELLGIPKPKESLRGLLSSRSVLSDDYGSIYIHFGDLIPLSSCIEGKLDRMVTACIPRHLLLYLTNEEKEVVRQLGYEITTRLQSHMVVTPSVMVAAIMLHNHDGLLLRDVVHKFAWLQQQCRELKIAVSPDDGQSNKEAVLGSIEFQKRCLELDTDGIVRIKDPVSTLEEPHSSSASSHVSRQQHHVMSSVKEVLDEAAIHLQLAYKRNTLLPYFYGIGIVSMSLRKQNSCKHDLGILSDDFAFLSRILVKEVAGIADTLNQIFHRSIDTMRSMKVISSDHNNHVTVEQEALIEFSSDLWYPLLTAYWLMLEHLSRNVSPRDEQTDVDVTKGAQQLAAELVLSGSILFYEVLSLELLQNALKVFIELRLVKANKRADGAVVITVSDRTSLNKTHQRIGGFLDIQSQMNHVSTPSSSL